MAMVNYMPWLTPEGTGAEARKRTYRHHHLRGRARSGRPYDLRRLRLFREHWAGVFRERARADVGPAEQDYWDKRADWWQAQADAVPDPSREPAAPSGTFLRGSAR